MCVCGGLGVKILLSDIRSRVWRSQIQKINFLPFCHLATWSKNCGLEVPDYIKSVFLIFFRGEGDIVYMWSQIKIRRVFNLPLGGGGQGGGRAKKCAFLNAYCRHEVFFGVNLPFCLFAFCTWWVKIIDI